MLCLCSTFFFFFFFNDTATTEIYTLSLHDALPIFLFLRGSFTLVAQAGVQWHDLRSEEHTSELQSRFDLVCRLLLEKTKKLCYLRLTFTKKKTQSHDMKPMAKHA